MTDIFDRIIQFATYLFGLFLAGVAVMLVDAFEPFNIAVTEG